MVVAFRGINDLEVDVSDASNSTSFMFPFMCFHEDVCVGSPFIDVFVYHISHFFALMSSKLCIRYMFVTQLIMTVVYLSSYRIKIEMVREEWRWIPNFVFKKGKNIGRQA